MSNKVIDDSKEDADDQGVSEKIMNLMFKILKGMSKTKAIDSSERLKQQILKLTTIFSRKKISNSRVGVGNNLKNQDIKATTKLLKQTLHLLNNVWEAARNFNSSNDKQHVPLSILLTYKLA